VKKMGRLKDFCLLGDSASSIGILGCVAQGRNLINKVCKEEKG